MIMHSSQYNDSNFQKIFIKFRSFLKSDRVVSRLCNFLINSACNAYTRGVFPRIFDKRVRKSNRAQNKNCGNLKFDANISGLSVISFDVFDTLLLRVSGSGIALFRALEKKYNCQGFATERVKAENRARVQKNSGEITLQDIYKNILPKYQNELEHELEMERLLCFPNEEFSDFFEKCKAEGKRIIAISDMYLPQSFIAKLLKNSGYEVDAVYVSSEFAKTKAKGDLFAYIREVEKGPILHIGDNYKSDILSAKRNGFSSVLYTRQNSKNFLSPKKDVLALKIHNGLLFFRDSFANFYEKIGYVFGGPIALSYSNFIAREFKANGLDMLLFTARDGWILQKIFSKYFPEITTSYVYLNRMVGIRGLCKWCDNPKYLK